MKSCFSKGILYLVFTIFCYSGYSQVQKKSNGLYIEVYGNGTTLLSLNYERKLFAIDSLNTFWARIGYTQLKHSYDNKRAFVFPVELDGLFGHQHCLEYGVGISFYLGTSNLKDTLIPEGYRSNFDYILTARLGYRWVMNDGRFIRIAPILFFKHETLESSNFKLVLAGGVSMGIAFNGKRKRSSVSK